MTTAAGNIGDHFTGSTCHVDYLGPLRRYCVSCGPMCLSLASVNYLTAANVTITGSIIQTGPPQVSGPNTHVWVPFGPTPIIAPGPHDIHIPIGKGSWELELLAVGTGADTGIIYAENFGHYNIIASLRSSGTSVSLVRLFVNNSSEFGTMVSPGPPAPFTVITFQDGGTELILRIVPIVNSSWSGYIRMVGAPPYV